MTPEVKKIWDKHFDDYEMGDNELVCNTKPTLKEEILAFSESYHNLKLTQKEK